MNRYQERAEALKALLGMTEDRPSRLRVFPWLAFLLGMIAMFFLLGIVPYWRLLLQLWNGCVA